MIADEATGVALAIPEAALPEGVLPENVRATVEPFAEAELEAVRAAITPESRESKFIAYHIELIDIANEKTFEPATSVRVTLPLPEDFDGELSVYHIVDGDGAPVSGVEISEASVSFETDAFSGYGLLSVEPEEDEGDDYDYGDVQNEGLTIRLNSTDYKNVSGDQVGGQAEDSVPAIETGKTVHFEIESALSDSLRRQDVEVKIHVQPNGCDLTFDQFGFDEATNTGEFMFKAPGTARGEVTLKMVRDPDSGEYTISVH